MTTEELRQAIERAGGLHTQAMLARRWHLSRTAVHDHVNRDGFPEGIDLDGTTFWTGNDADAWLATWEPGRPGPKPRVAA